MRFGFRRAALIASIVALASAASACAAVLGIDDVEVRDAGPAQDATTLDASADATVADGGAFFCNDPTHPHDLCADFEEGNARAVFGPGVQTFLLDAVTDGGTLGLASFGNASASALEVSTEANDTVNADADVEESFLEYDSTTPGTTFVLDFDVQTPTANLVGSGHIDYPSLQINDLDGGSSLQFYLAINAVQGPEIAAVNTGPVATPSIVTPISTLQDQTEWMHVELRVTLQPTGDARLLAFLGNQASAAYDHTMSNTPIRGRAHLALGLVTSGNAPTTTLQIDNVTLDTN